MNPSIENLVASQIQSQGNPQVAMSSNTPGYQPSLSTPSVPPSPDKSITSSFRSEETPAHRYLKRMGIPVTPSMHAQIMAAQGQLNQQPIQAPPPTPPMQQMPVVAQPSKPQKVSESERAGHQQQFMQTLERMLGKIV